MTTEPLAYSVQDAADLIGISKPTVYRMMRDAEIRTVMVRGRRLVPRSALLEILGEPPDASNTP